MITIPQIKAARALLDWKQSDLAKAANLSLPAINNLERGNGSPRLDTLNSIELAFVKAGIEFTERDGLRRRGEDLDIIKYEGPDFVSRLTDDMLSVLRGPADEVLMCGINERKFDEFGREACQRYADNAVKRDFRERILACEGDNYFVSRPECYRWVPERLFGKLPYMVYGDHSVFMFWNAPQRCLIIRNQSLADTFRVQFDYLWEMAKPHGLKKTSRI